MLGHQGPYCWVNPQRKRVPHTRSPWKGLGEYQHVLLVRTYSVHTKKRLWNSISVPGWEDLLNREPDSPEQKFRMNKCTHTQAPRAFLPLPQSGTHLLAQDDDHALSCQSARQFSAAEIIPGITGLCFSKTTADCVRERGTPFPAEYCGQEPE